MTTATIEQPSEGPQILRLITEVKKKAGALAPAQSSGVPFPFRGIDGTVNHLSQHVEEAGIVIVPEVLEQTTTPREVGNRVVKTTEIRTAFHFYAPDGSSVTAITSGLADDFADRSAAQAQSVAFRIALLQTFFLPTQSPEPEQTGQAVQDAKPEQRTPTKAKIENARPAPKPAANAPAGDVDTIKELQAKIREAIGSGAVDRGDVNKAMDAGKAEGKSGVALQQYIIKTVGI